MLTGNSAALLLATARFAAAAPPMLVTLMVVAALVVPTLTLPNSALGGLSCTFAVAAATPVPDMLTTIVGLPVELMVSAALSMPVLVGA